MKYDTDKDVPHGYLPDYSDIAAAIGPAGTVCEVGVCRGGSLDMWLDLFPTGTVIGVDCDQSSRWPEGTRQVIAMQNDPGLAREGPRARAGRLRPDHRRRLPRRAPYRATFETLWPLVRPGGFYVVEDWADPWVDPSWGVADENDRLVEWVPSLIHSLKNGAATVSYTREGLAVVRGQDDLRAVPVPGQARPAVPVGDLPAGHRAGPIEILVAVDDDDELLDQYDDLNQDCGLGIEFRAFPRKVTGGCTSITRPSPTPRTETG